MDPGIAVGIGVLSKIIGFGIKGWSAVGDRDLNKEDLEALRALLDTSASVLAARKPGSAQTGVLHLTLIAHSFGRAVARHQEFHGKLPLAGGVFRWWNRSEREREAEIEQRVKLAALGVRKLGDDPRAEIDQIAALTAHPLATPYYQALWHAFSSPELTIEEAGEQPPLAMSSSARREFERYFLLAYLEGIATPGGAGIDEYLDGLRQYRCVLVRDLLLSNLATWGQRHVFGNVARHSVNEREALPFMPLDEVYVEPDGVIERDGQGQGDRQPIVGLIERLTAASAPPRLILVVANFGSGKSLTARTLARRWAESFLASAAGTSLDLPLPIHVRCAEDFPSETVDIELTVRRAWRRQACAIDYAVSDDDAVFAWPNPEQHVRCLLDGLDEVALGEQHLKTLLQKLCAKTTRKHRFVVFTRPGALLRRDQLGGDVTVVRVQPFDDAPEGQIARWLAAWAKLRPDQPAITLAQLQDRGLAAIAQTPILLFMIAFTWQHHAAGVAPPSLAEIYEHFFCQVAAGKAEVDHEEHGPIARASQELRTALVEAGVITDDANETDAMLWLMGRVAWEAHMIEQRPVPAPLTLRDLDHLLADPRVAIPASAIDTIRIGLVLALQADLHGANHTILFGHQSFREFLVARYWASVLQRLVHGRRRDHDRWIGLLRGGRLISRDSKAIDFLMAFINNKAPRQRTTSPLCWNDEARDELVGFMQDIFEDERQVFGERVRTTRNADPTLRNDQQAELRVAALAIGSLTRGSRGMRTRDPSTLRSMIAWFWFAQEQAMILAPGGQFAGAQLHGAQLSGSDLRGANLRVADLGAANLRQCDLRGADLTLARLENANLTSSLLDGAVAPHTSLLGANLAFAKADKADFREASFGAAKLFQTSFRGADLAGTDFSEVSGGCGADADFTEANLAGAILSNLELRRTKLARANLRGAKLSGTDLAGGDLRGADLRDADLGKANLHDTDLCGADLRGADLRGAVLRDADLRGADLRGADLRGVDLRDAGLEATEQDWRAGENPALGPARFDATTLTDEGTQWPERFDGSALRGFVPESAQVDPQADAGRL